jgi:WD40 repeat protein
MNSTGAQAYWQWKASAKSGNWKPYKSTLSVTIEGIARPAGYKVAHRSRLPWEIEQGEEELNLKAGKDKSERRQSEAHNELDTTRLGNKWVGATGKWCRVPNVPMHKLDSDHRGCFVLAFSTYGTLLACATGGRQMYKIKIYNVANGVLAATLAGHHEIVYDMEWGNVLLDENDAATRKGALKASAAAGGGAGDASKGARGEGGEADKRGGQGDAQRGKLLLTASADTTAKVWDVDSRELLAACHHPSYVYAARFCPGPDGVKGDTDGERALSACANVVTGCYDHSIRLWDVGSEAVSHSRAGLEQGGVRVTL